MKFFSQIFGEFYFGFIRGHSYIDSVELKNIELLVDKEDEGVVSEYEKSFAKVVGNGYAISYAAARMGFYDLMCILGIKNGDEVILLGSTCSVMVNAVLRIGAMPIYSDIDPSTLGSSAASIEGLITENTKIIVAQHSFGLPCLITPIVELAKKYNIFLLEDCALTVGSSMCDIAVGNFGDAALFSTDHSKPINTIIGGLIYTNNFSLFNRLKTSQESLNELSVARRRALWKKLLFERSNCNPEKFWAYKLVEKLNSLLKRIKVIQDDFLSEDNGLVNKTSYPYPAKIPTFLAAVGIIEIKRWRSTAKERSEVLHILMEALSECGLLNTLPLAYRNSLMKIIPLRISWCDTTNGVFKRLIKKFLDVSQFWFTKPIISTRIGLESLAYRRGSCPISEFFGHNIINLPCNITINQAKILANLIRKGMHEENVSKKLAGNKF